MLVDPPTLEGGSDNCGQGIGSTDADTGTEANADADADSDEDADEDDDDDAEDNGLSAPACDMDTVVVVANDRDVEGCERGLGKSCISFLSSPLARTCPPSFSPVAAVSLSLLLVL